MEKDKSPPRKNSPPLTSPEFYLSFFFFFCQEGSKDRNSKRKTINVEMQIVSKSEIKTKNKNKLFGSQTKIPHKDMKNQINTYSSKLKKLEHEKLKKKEH